MRVFKLKSFARWARKAGITDAALLIAASEVKNGQYDSDLGGKVYKKRIALKGRGKSGSTRTFLALRDGERAFFMFGFSKNEKSNVDSDESKALKLMAKQLLDKDCSMLKKEIKQRILIEVS